MRFRPFDRALLVSLMAWPVLVCAAGRFATVDGLKIYYEVHGTATPGQVPLLLLHGGSETIDTSFSKVLPLLASKRLVIAIEQQGHGHTADLDRPFSYERLSDDTAAVLDHECMQQVDCFGWSDGGKVGLMLAMRHPDRVRKLMVSGANFRQDGLQPAAIQWLKNSKATDADWAETRVAYERVAPDPRPLGGVRHEVARLLYHRARLDHRAARHNPRARARDDR